MVPLYRRSIEGNGSRFEYHAGQVNRGTKGLEQQVRRADLVLCPTDHTGNSASRVAKRLGKQYGKPLRMLANPSVRPFLRSFRTSNSPDAPLWQPA